MPPTPHSNVKYSRDGMLALKWRLGSVRRSSTSEFGKMKLRGHLDDARMVNMCGLHLEVLVITRVGLIKPFLA